MVLGGIMAKGIWMVSEWCFEWYFGLFVMFSGIEWYFKLPLRVPLGPTEILLNGSMVLNDTESYSMVISGIPLALFYRSAIFYLYNTFYVLAKEIASNKQIDM